MPTVDDKTEDAPLPLLGRLRLVLDDCHPMERRLAESVLDFPGDLASYSASELAAHAGVSNSTVTRLIKRIGYRNFEEARRHVREARVAGSPIFLASREHVPGRVNLHRMQSTRNVQESFAGWNDKTLNTMAHAFLKSRRCWVVGFRSSLSFAAYMRWQLFQFKQDVQLIPGPSDTVGQYLAGIQERDLVIAFGLRRRPAQLHALVNKVQALGAHVLYVTDDAISKAPPVRWHVRCACTGNGPLDDHTAVMAFCHLLSSRIFELAGPKERDRLQSIDSLQTELREL